MIKYPNILLRINKIYNKRFLNISFIVIFSLVLITKSKKLLIHSNAILTIFYVLAILFMVIISIKYFTHLYYRTLSKDVAGPNLLHKRIILAFCLLSAVPTIIVALFSTYIFNTALQPWFDKKITNILQESTAVANAYIDDQVAHLRENGLSIASDFGDMSYMLLNNPRLLGELLNGQAELRSLDEAIIFENNTNTILAQTPLSFSLAFATIPKYLIEMADQGKAVQIPSDPTKVRFLVKLPDYKNAYLLIGRLINKQIIEHIDKNKGAANAYFALKQDITHLQIKFSILFLIIACILLVMAIIWGIVIASQIVKPIQNLVLATENAQNGDLTVQVSEENLVNDEVKTLTIAFNLMIKKLNRQHKDLIIAQRALAWSDVARRIAHEIKNPLTPMQLASERLMKKFGNEVTDKESFARYLRTILNHSKDIERIVAEFVNFARMPLPTFAKFNIVELVSELVATRKLLNEQIQYFINTEHPIINFIGDAMQINRAVLNLLKNAEEALEKKEGEANIKIYLVTNKEELQLIIKDNGPGFTDCLINRASEAYVTSRSKGMGLGLAIVKKIVEDHLGVIDILNNNCTEGGGACVKLIFNLNELKNKLPYN